VVVFAIVESVYKYERLQPLTASPAYLQSANNQTEPNLITLSFESLHDEISNLAVIYGSMICLV